MGRYHEEGVLGGMKEVGVHTVYIYSIPIHIVIFANDTDTFPILITISFSKFVIKKRDK